MAKCALHAAHLILTKQERPSLRCAILPSHPNLGLLCTSEILTASQIPLLLQIFSLLNICSAVSLLNSFLCPDHHVVAPLPFELQVLEAMLKDISGLADQLTKDLEAVAHPALDALTKSVRFPPIPYETAGD